jgi:hypothetical protein
LLECHLAPGLTCLVKHLCWWALSPTLAWCCNYGTNKVPMTFWWGMCSSEGASSDFHHCSLLSSPEKSSQGWCKIHGACSQNVGRGLHGGTQHPIAPLWGCQCLFVLTITWIGPESTVTDGQQWQYFWWCCCCG